MPTATFASDVISPAACFGETKPIRFLRYYLIASYDFDRVPTATSVFDWITSKDNKARLGYGKNPAAFADKLMEAAKAYANFSTGQDQVGNDVPALAAITSSGQECDSTCAC